MTLFGARHLYFSRDIAHGLARGLVALLMLSHGLLAFSSVVSQSHDPLRAITSAHELAHVDTDQDDHGHGHEADDEGGVPQNDHNPADHSHEKPNLPPTYRVNTPPLSDRWLADEHRLDYISPRVCLKRPPKRLSIV